MTNPSRRNPVNPFDQRPSLGTSRPPWHYDPAAKPGSGSPLLRTSLGHPQQNLPSQASEISRATPLPELTGRRKQNRQGFTIFVKNKIVQRVEETTFYKDTSLFLLRNSQYDEDERPEFRNALTTLFRVLPGEYSATFYGRGLTKIIQGGLSCRG